MKILFANDNLIGGGVEKLMNDLLPLINQVQRCDLLILTWEGEKYRKSLEESGVKVEAVPENIRGHIGRINYIKNFIEQGNYDVVHANEFPMLYYCSVAGRMMRKKPLMIVTEHATSNRRRKYRLFRHIERWAYNGFDKIISISPETQLSIINWLSPIDRTKFVTVYNGVPIKEFRLTEPYQREEVYYGIKDQDVILCMAGRLSDEKNHTFMFGVMERLPQNYKLLVCGDGELYDKLVHSVNERGLSERVCFLGFRNDMAAIMKTSDIIVIPSKWEGFGLISVEAMACGKPIVCSDVPGLSVVVGNAGIKVKVYDCEGFAKAIMKLSDSSVYERLVANGKIQCQKFDINRTRDGYLSVYETAKKRRCNVWT